MKGWKNQIKNIEFLLLFVFELDYDSEDKLITCMHANMLMCLTGCANV